MKKLITLLLVVEFLFCEAQTYIPFPGIGAQWNTETFDSGNPSCPGAIYSTLTLTHDTVINSVNYVNMRVSGYYQYYINPNPNCQGIYQIIPGHNIGAVREDTANKIVYYCAYGPSNFVFTLINFNLQLGALVNPNVIWGQTIDFHVSNIDSILLGTQYHKRYFFRDTVWNTPCLYGDSMIIEGIGAASGLFDPPILLDQGGHLLCFSINGQQVYPVYGGTPCTIYTGMNEAASNAPGTVYPNPFTNELKVSFNSAFARIEVLDMTGQVLLKASGNEAEINSKLSGIAEDLLPGLYMLRLESGRGEIVSQKVIKM